MPGCGRQAGAVLFVSLFMLLMISLIGVAGIRSAVLEKNMAANNQYEMLVFQGAESAIEGVVADDDVFIEAINTGAGESAPERSYTLDHDDQSFSISSMATISAGAPQVALNYSLGEFASYPFTITSTSAITSINASDTHVQTVSKIAPYLF